MGLLADRWETRNKPEWLNDDDSMYDGPVSSAGVRVSRNSALGLTTVWRCWDLLSSAIAMSPRDVIVKVGGKSFAEFNPPSWLSSPNPVDPTHTANDYFAQVALSILAHGNFYTYVYPHVFDPQVLTVLDPLLVEVRPGPVYVIKDRAGNEIARRGPADMLHGKWLPMPGGLIGMSPLESLRTALGAALATQEHAAKFFGQGASLSFGVEVPGPMDDVKKASMRDSLRRKYAGLQNSHAIGVLTHGAKFVSGLAPTPEQAQMLASREFSVEDVCRIYGVPAAMAGSTQPGAASFASTDNYGEWFRQNGVQPLAERIESQHNRLLQLPSGITDSGASVQFKFNLDSINRSTLLTRYQAHSEGVKGGFLTPNEARGLEDFQPMPGGDLLYMLQQMVPLSDLGKTKATEPLDTQPKPAGSPQPTVSPPPARSEPPVVIHNHLPDINIPAEMRIPAPVVNVAPADVRLKAPDIHIDNHEMAELVRSLLESIEGRSADEVRALRALMADMPVPVVNVTTPSELTIKSMPTRMTSRKVTRDRSGQITDTTDVQSDI